jgi:hypothetical protein
VTAVYPFALERPHLLLEPLRRDVVDGVAAVGGRRLDAVVHEDRHAGAGELRRRGRPGDGLADVDVGHDAERAAG